MKLHKHPLSGHGELVPWGILVHSTGDGIPKIVVDSGKDAVQVTCDVYQGMADRDGVGPHYAIVPDGRIIEFRAPNETAYHAATSASEREAFLNGSWATSNKLDQALVQWWKLRWPKYKSPQHLYPSKSPNGSYIGVELVPCGTYSANSWQPVLAMPATPKGRYTARQYQALALLGSHLAGAYSWPDSWWETPRLAGHCDVNLFSRPGWDPGAYRGWFSWLLLRGMIEVLDTQGVWT